MKRPAPIDEDGGIGTDRAANAALIVAARNLLTLENLLALCAALAAPKASLTVQEDEAIAIINDALDNEVGRTHIADVMCYQVPILLSIVSRLTHA